MIPQPYNDAGLIMQGFSTLGQGAGQFAEQQRQTAMQNAPIDPQLEAFARARMRQAIERIDAGGDPRVEAANYKQDLANILKGGAGVRAPQVNMPDIVGRTVGPSSQMQGASQVPPTQQSAFSGDMPPKQMSVALPPQTDLSGNTVRMPQQTLQPQPKAPQQARPPSQRINQTAAPQQPAAPQSRMTQRQFDDFAKLNPQFQSMDQIEMTRQSGANKLALAEQNNTARAMMQQAREAGLDERASASLVLKAQQIEAVSGVKVFDIMMRLRGLNATLGSRERVAGLNRDQRLQYARLYQRMFADAARAKAAAESVGDESGAAMSQSMMDAATQGSNILGVTNIEEGVIDPGSPGKKGIVFDTPPVPPKTGPVAKPLPASPVGPPATSTSTSKSTTQTNKTQKRREGLGL
jgi:hypothetical protein